MSRVLADCLMSHGFFHYFLCQIGHEEALLFGLASDEAVVMEEPLGALLNEQNHGFVIQVSAVLQPLGQGEAQFVRLVDSQTRNQRVESDVVGSSHPANKFPNGIFGFVCEHSLITMYQIDEKANNYWTSLGEDAVDRTLITTPNA